MDKIKLLTIAIIALLLLNFGTLGFLLFKGPKHDHKQHPHEPKQIIISKLQLDVSQQKIYQKSIYLHRETIDSLDNKIRETKNGLYLQLLKTTVDIKSKDSLISVLANNQKQIELTHFKHFQDIKNLCKPEQLERFYDLTEELSRIFGKQTKRRHG